MVKQIKIYLEFFRPFTLLPPALGMISGAFIGIEKLSIFLILKILIGGLLASILNGASNAINQIYDLPIDKINKPTRPIPSGKLSLKEAWWLTILAYVFSIGISFTLDFYCGVIFSIAAIFTIIYSVPPLRTKRNWLLATITIAIPRGILLRVAGWSIVEDIFYLEPWYIGIIFFLFLCGAASTKDYADIKGDSKMNCITLPIRFGIKKSAFIISPFFIFPFLLFPLGVYFKILKGNLFFLNFLGITLCLWGIYTVYLILKDPDSLSKVENHPSWINMYLMMMYAQIGLIFAYFI